MACFPRRIRLLLVLTLLGSLAALSGCFPIGGNPDVKVGVPEVDSFPAWAPNGQRIAYFRDADPTEDTTDVTGLYVLDLETESVRLLVSDEPIFEYAPRSPDWRSDGKRIAFDAGNIFTIRPDGSDPRRVTEFGRVSRPRWSPDGRAISFGRSGTNEESGLWFAQVSDSTFTKFGSGGISADWSPDGTHVVYSYDSQVCTADTSRTDSTKLTDNDFLNFNPVWSPNGRWIAWSRSKGAEYELWIMRADGSEQRMLADRGRQPAWGPNSNRIVFARPARSSDYTALWIVDRDGSNLGQITQPSRNPLN